MKRIEEKQFQEQIEPEHPSAGKWVSKLAGDDNQAAMLPNCKEDYITSIHTHLTGVGNVLLL